jgi:hypothetical protein
MVCQERSPSQKAAVRFSAAAAGARMQLRFEMLEVVFKFFDASCEGEHVVAHN